MPESVVDITYETTLSDSVSYCNLSDYRVFHYFADFSTISTPWSGLIALAHFAASLEENAVFNDQRPCENISLELGSALEFQLLLSLHCSLNRTTYNGLVNIDITLDDTVPANRKGSCYVYFSIHRAVYPETALYPERSFAEAAWSEY